MYNNTLKLIHKNKKLVDLEFDVFEKIVRQYPEEKLHERNEIKSALENRKITIDELKKFSKLINIDFEMFFLYIEKFEKEIKNIEKNRKDKYKFESGEFGVRTTRAVSFRLIDRFIRLQNFTSSCVDKVNKFNESLKGLDYNLTNTFVENFFDINIQEFRSGSKKDAMEYLIKKIEKKNISVCRSFQSLGMMPTIKGLTSLYAEMDGFYLIDNNNPYIFIFNERTTNKPDTTDTKVKRGGSGKIRYTEDPIGKQTYTLVYFLIKIGLGDKLKYTDIKLDLREVNPYTEENEFAHSKTSYFFIRKDDIKEIKKNYFFQSIKNEDIVQKIKDIGERYKITPSAVRVRLFQEGILTKEQNSLIQLELFQEWEKRPIKRNSNSIGNKLKSAQRKFLGKLNYRIISSAYDSKQITKNQYNRMIYGNARGYEKQS